MKPEQITAAMEEVAKQLGIQVRYETMTGEASGAGGLCRIRDQWHVIMDRKTAPSDKAVVLAEALVNFDTDSLKLPAPVKAILDREKHKRAAATTLPPGDTTDTPEKP